MAGWGPMMSPIFRLAHRLKEDILLCADEDDAKKDALFWVETCQYIEDMLADAEEREVRDAAVKRWLHSLKVLAADAEDLLEEYEYHLEGEEESSRARNHEEMEGILDENEQQRVRATCLNGLLKWIGRIFDIPSMMGYERIQPRLQTDVQPRFLNELPKRIQSIRQRFKDIYERRKAFRLEEYHRDRRAETSLRPQAVGHLANESITYGRRREKKYLVDLLKNNNQNNEYIGHIVVGLVGVGGIGKTTLAQALYRDEEINDYFNHCKAWVTVSEPLDALQVTKDILESFTREAVSNFTQLSVVQEKLVEQLREKKFFLVLDDVWQEKWSNHLGFLRQMGLPGSKILITTRITRVVKAVPPSIVFDLKPLSMRNGWKLFRSHAFGGKRVDHVAPNLVSIGKKIAQEKCRGSPLLLKVLGDYLREAGDDEDRWTEISNHKAWEHKDDSGGNYVMEILKLSYDHLPRRWRQCFLHCSVFPKDYVFRMVDLVRLWAAYGLFETEESKQVGDIGKECVNGLLHRSFIQQVGATFSLHDLMHDLAQHIIYNEQHIDRKPLSTNNTLSLHHPLMSRASHETPRFCYEPTAGRTFLHSWYPLEQVPTIINMLAQHLKRLRVLIVDDLEDIPDSIGDLKHLRYLGLGSYSWKKLPDSVCLLHNLQTLECRGVKELPRDMRRLKRLQHLLVGFVAKLPPGIGELIELQTLDTFNLWKEGDGECARLSELRDMSQLGGALYIYHLEYVKVEEAELSSLSSKPNLKHLFLSWNGRTEITDAQQSMQVLSNLKPNHALKELKIFGYPGCGFPNWLGSPSFAKLTFVRLSTCFNCERLPALGQLPSLRTLELIEMYSVKCIGVEFYGTSPISNAFPSLQELHLSNVEDLSEWWGMDKCPFPWLTKLRLQWCPSLRFSHFNKDVGLARMFGTVEDIQVIDCPHMEKWREDQANYDVGLARMFNTVEYMDVNRCPHLEKWCKDHANTTLAKVQNIVINGRPFRGEAEDCTSDSDDDEDSDDEA